MQTVIHTSTNLESHPVCVAANYSPWIGLQLEVPAQHLEAALRNPDAVQVALQAGRLDLIVIVLGVLSIFLAIFGLLGYNFVSEKAHRVAKEEAKTATRTAVPEFLQSQIGVETLRQALADPVVVAKIQQRLLELGLGNASDAVIVDSEPDFRDGYDGNGSDSNHKSI